MPKPGIEPGAAAWDPLALPTELLRDWWQEGINLWPKMQQNHLLYCMHIQRDLFGGLASILGCPRAFSRLPTLEDWPFRPLRGLKGQISRLAASLRPRQPKISARQPKKSCCLCIQCNKRPFLSIFLSYLFSAKLEIHHSLELQNCCYNILQRLILKEEHVPLFTE